MLLAIRYAAGDYVRVPAKHGGDCGIEGYSIPDGRAYQCYAPETPLPTTQLYEHQRRKMATDVKKFIANRERLLAVLGTTRIRRWLLVVPEHRSIRLNEYAVRKTEEVRAAGLPYVTDDFHVVVVTDDDFALERNKLYEQPSGLVRLPEVLIDGEVLDLFAAKNAAAMEHLERKVKSIVPRDLSARAEVVQQLLEAYVIGTALLQRLHDLSPALHEQLLSVAARAAKEIRLKSRITTVPASELVQQTIGTLKVQILRAAPSLELHADDLTMQIVADWLMRCPLDFSVTSMPVS
ncbi:hypothetical protein J421_4642 (plasmid) [Gemmatirosa kalamazoonensis]|uniref:Uncharacterized protein n=1 Tax=Gemmatirosa kalamazoonensis TaxID=861299 RepID=W0RNW9_9BACT|nr:hypothetical protein [Gemmatirosa kalamazoonensis]AHG92109.1 hypothetical protein J421_4574 [Gemmatirosa kalamazoonensis]AHG92177.1 hypothetical protein J421_4642 [Gemmatirosa kalamazoonensis]